MDVSGLLSHDPPGLGCEVILCHLICLSSQLSVGKMRWRLSVHLGNLKKYVFPPRTWVWILALKFKESVNPVLCFVTTTVSDGVFFFTLPLAQRRYVTFLTDP